eukprot:TRINITY_DN17389_c0_g1_i4.p1 TRINITY_DN17389_c0_g1~~TRINITY_DN17389_c0_g1_i4.p1  ORF type:complete len:265 (+),score=63.77 TRINITY_DN17389_c0_g1_i4:149-943(+)
MIRRPPRSTLSSSSAASDVYKRQVHCQWLMYNHDPLQDHSQQIAFCIARSCWTSLIAHQPNMSANAALSNRSPIAVTRWFQLNGEVSLSPMALETVLNELSQEPSLSAAHRGIAEAAMTSCKKPGSAPVTPNSLFESLTSEAAMAGVLASARRASSRRAVTASFGASMNQVHPGGRPSIACGHPGTVDRAMEDAADAFRRKLRRASVLMLAQIGKRERMLRMCKAVDSWHFTTFLHLSLIHISEPTRLLSISYAVFCLKKKKKR